MANPTLLGLFVLAGLTALGTAVEPEKVVSSPLLAKEQSLSDRRAEARGREEDGGLEMIPDEPSSPPAAVEAQDADRTESPREDDKDEWTWDRVRKTAVGRVLLSCWRTAYMENHPRQNPDEACGAPWLRGGEKEDAASEVEEMFWSGAAPQGSEETTIVSGAASVASAEEPSANDSSGRHSRPCPARVPAFSVFSETLVRDILNTLRLSGGAGSHWEREFGGESLEEKFSRLYDENVFSRIEQLQPHDWFVTMATHLARNDMLEGFFQSKIAILEGHPEEAEWKTERPKHDHSPQDHFVMNSSFHYSLVLDAVARLMDDHPGAEVLADVVDHFKRVREKLKLLWYTDGAFEQAKLFTVEPAMRGRTPHTQPWAVAYGGGEYRTQDLNWTLRANIYEASVTDMANKFVDNADAGVHMVVSSERGWPADESFQRLYESWNMCFVTGNFKEAPLFWSKLYAPTVTGARPEA